MLPAPELQFGVARVDITPRTPLPMGGYGGRTGPFEGVHDPLYFTALYLRCEEREVWIGSADLVQFPDGAERDAALAALGRRLGCPPESIFLNATHTHGGPLTTTSFGVPNPFNRVARSGENKARTDAWVAGLWETIGDTLEAARRDLQPGTLHRAEGSTTFPMNRRCPSAHGIHNAPNPRGAFDQRLRLLGVHDAEDRLRVLLPILACHPTATGSQRRLTADFVGAWRARVAREWPGVTFLFLQACGADARPAATAAGTEWTVLPPEALEPLGAHLWRETAAAVASGWHPLGVPQLDARSAPLVIPCTTSLLNRDLLASMTGNGSPWIAAYARECLRRRESREEIPSEVTFRLQTVRLTDSCTLLGMDAEPLWGLGRYVERTLAAHHPILLGYVNGCVGYLPDTAALHEGGYECESFYWGPWSGPFQSGTEHRVAMAFRDLLLSQPDSPSRPLFAVP